MLQDTRRIHPKSKAIQCVLLFSLTVDPASSVLFRGVEMNALSGPFCRSALTPDLVQWGDLGVCLSLPVPGVIIKMWPQLPTLPVVSSNLAVKDVRDQNLPEVLLPVP